MSPCTWQPPSKSDPKPPLEPLPETAEQRRARERKLLAERRASADQRATDAFEAELDAAARAWAAAWRHERPAIISAFAQKFPRSHSAAQKRIMKRAHELRLEIRGSPRA